MNNDFIINNLWKCSNIPFSRKNSKFCIIVNFFYLSVGWKKMVGAKKWKRSINEFLSFSLLYLMLTSILPRINKFIPIIEERRKKLLSVWFFVFGVTIKFDYLLITITLHNFVVFVTKDFWVFINYTVHRNKLVDMFINNIKGVINKVVSFFRLALN